MKLILMFHSKNGKAEMTYEENWVGAIPRIKESVYCDEAHQGVVFNVIFNFPQKEVVVKLDSLF